MKALMVMYDSLRRDLLSVYDGPIPAPNFERLAAHTVCFDKSYVGSLPCMPARRELHTGRYNFLHRSWGPMEPYDDSMPEILKSTASTAALLPTITIMSRMAVAPTTAVIPAGAATVARKVITGWPIWPPPPPSLHPTSSALKEQPARCVKCAAMAAGRTCTTASACIVKRTSR